MAWGCAPPPPLPELRAMKTVGQARLELIAVKQT